MHPPGMETAEDKLRVLLVQERDKNAEMTRELISRRDRAISHQAGTRARIKNIRSVIEGAHALCDEVYRATEPGPVKAKVSQLAQKLAMLEGAVIQAEQFADNEPR